MGGHLGFTFHWPVSIPDMENEFTDWTSLLYVMDYVIHEVKNGQIRREVSASDVLLSLSPNLSWTTRYVSLTHGRPIGSCTTLRLFFRISSVTNHQIKWANATSRKKCELTGAESLQSPTRTSLPARGLFFIVDALFSAVCRICSNKRLGAY